MVSLPNQTPPAKHQEKIAYAEQMLEHHATLTRFRKGQYLFREGESPDCIYVIKHGLIKVSQNTEDGQEVTFFLRRDGQSTGLSEAILGQTRLRYACCLLDSDVLVLPMSEVAGLFEDATFLFGLLLKLSRNFLLMQNNFAALTSQPAAVRLASFLKSLAVPRDDGSWKVELPISHEEISHLVGCSRQKTTQILNSWKNLELISYSRDTLIIHNMAALQQALQD